MRIRTSNNIGVQIHQLPPEVKTVQYDGHFYAVVCCRDSKHTKIQCDRGFTPVLNLKTQQFRGIANDAIVYPVDAEVSISKLRGYS